MKRLVNIFTIDHTVEVLINNSLLQIGRSLIKCRSAALSLKKLEQRTFLD